MITITDVLHELGISDYIVRGKPTNETEFNSMFVRVTAVDDVGNITEETNPANFGVTWTEISAKKTELENNESLKLLRMHRNSKLTETDWWVLPDRTATDEQLAYRQALRDITDTYSSLDTVVWPTKP